MGYLGDRWHYFFPFCALFLLGIAIGSYLVWASVQEIVIGALFLTCLVPSTIALSRRSFDLFEPIVFYSVFMFMITVAIFDRLYIQEPFLRHSEWIPWDFSTAFLIVSLLYLVFFLLVLVSYYIEVERWIPIPTARSADRTHAPEVFFYSGIVYLVVGAVFYTALVGSALDWNLLRLYTTTEPRSQLFAASQHLVLGSKMLYFGYFLWVVSLLLKNVRPGIRHFLPVLPIFGLFILLGGRQRAISIVLVTIIIYYYVHIYPIFSTTPGKIRFAADQLHRRIKSVSIPVTGVFAGTVLIAVRMYRSWRDFDGNFDIDLLTDLATFGVHNSHLDNLLVTLEVVPEHFGYYWGTLSFRVPVNYIPRAIWNDKPVLTIGSELRRVILPSQAGGRDPGLLGQFYADAGLFGILVGAVLFGITLRLLYVTFERNSHSPVALLVYALILASVVPGGIDNNSLWAVSNHLLLLSPVVVLDWAYRNWNSH